MTSPATLSRTSCWWEAPVMARPGDEIEAGMGGRGDLRASRADREQVIDRLKVAFVQGRLGKDEFDVRVSHVLASRTYADLAVLTADILTEPTGAQPLGPARPSDSVPAPKNDCARDRRSRGREHGVYWSGADEVRREPRCRCGRRGLDRLVGSRADSRASVGPVNYLQEDLQEATRSEGAGCERQGGSATRIGRPGRTAPADQSRTTAHSQSCAERSSPPAIGQFAPTADTEGRRAISVHLARVMSG